MAEMARPVAGADRAGDQPVCGCGIGDAEQSLGEAEQQHPLLARQPIFMEQRVDAALLAPSVARRFDEVARQQLDLAALIVARARLGDQRLDQRALFGEQRCPDRLASGRYAARSSLGFAIGKD